MSHEKTDNFDLRSSVQSGNRINPDKQKHRRSSTGPNFD